MVWPPRMKRHHGRSLSIHELLHGDLIGLLRSSPFCPPVLEPDLHSSFCEADPQSQILPHEDIRIVSLCKGSLQLLQLVAGEGGPEPSLLTFAIALGVTLVALVRRLRLPPLRRRLDGLGAD